MRKALTADKVKKLPPSTDVWIVDEETGKCGMMWIVKSGRKKFLKGIVAEHEIKDFPGKHYEIEVNT